MAPESPDHKPVATLVPLARARADLGALVERLATSDERFVIEKDGLPIAALIGIDEFEDYLELNDPEVKKGIAESRENYLAGRSRPAQELLRELEEEEKRERQSEPTAR